MNKSIVALLSFWLSRHCSCRKMTMTMTKQCH